MKVASKTPGVRIRSNIPRFRYSFKEANEPLEIPKEHAEKILKNSNFHISDKEVKKPKKASQIKPQRGKTWAQELEEISGIGKKTTEDILDVYPDKGSLLSDLSKDEKIPFRDDVVKLLKETFIH